MLDYAAFPQQRQARIRQLLQENGRVVCAELASQMQVSEHTIRRDLQELSNSGICKKVYGGAVLPLPEAGNFHSRKVKNRSEKDKIAQQCAALVKPDTCIFIDAGTTNLAIARALPTDIRITVVTNSPEIAVELMTRSHSEVILLGGQIHQATGGCVGSGAVAQIQEMLFDQVFIGGCAMDPDIGLTGFDFADCEFKKAVLKQSNQTIVALTADKLPGVARYVVARPQALEVIIVEANISDALRTVLKEHHITLITA